MWLVKLIQSKLLRAMGHVAASVERSSLITETIVSKDILCVFNSLYEKNKKQKNKGKFVTVAHLS